MIRMTNDAAPLTDPADLKSFAEGLAQELGPNCRATIDEQKDVRLIDDEGRALRLECVKGRKLTVHAAIDGAVDPSIGVTAVSADHVARHIRRRLYPEHAEAVAGVAEAVAWSKKEEEARTAVAQPPEQSPRALFGRVWSEGALISDVADVLTCTQVESLARVLTHLADLTTARRWVTMHAAYTHDAETQVIEHRFPTAVPPQREGTGGAQLTDADMQRFAREWSDYDLIDFLADLLDCRHINALTGALRDLGAPDPAQQWLTTHQVGTGCGANTHSPAASQSSKDQGMNVFSEEYRRIVAEGDAQRRPKVQLPPQKCRDQSPHDAHQYETAITETLVRCPGEAQK